MTLSEIPVEIQTSICQCLEFDRQALRNLRQVNKTFNIITSPLLFRRIFLSVNPQSFLKLLRISRHDTLRQCVEILDYDGRELPPITDFEDWVEWTAATELGLTERRSEFLAQFSQLQLKQYYSNFCHYESLTRQTILRGHNEIRWLRAAIQRFPRLSTIGFTAYIEMMNKDGSPELPSITDYSPLVQKTLVEPPAGNWDEHFWRLVRAVFGGQGHRQVPKELWGCMLDLESFAKAADYIPRLDISGLQLLHFDFDYDSHDSPALAPTQALVRFLERAPNLTSLELYLGQSPAPPFNTANFLPTGLFNTPLFWKQLRHLTLGNLVLSPLRLQQFLKQHSATLRSLELLDVCLQCSSETINQPKRALWIEMIEFLSKSMSLESVDFVGNFTTDTNEAWSTSIYESYNVIRAQRYEGCLFNRIKYYIIHGGPCPFIPKTLFIDDDAPWTPEHSWTWEADRTWSLSLFLITV